MGYIMKHPFPGNVRELQNMIEHAFILCHGPVIHVSHFPKDTRETMLTPTFKTVLPIPCGLLEHAECEQIKRLLVLNRFSRKDTAKELGIDVSTLWRKMKRFGLLEQQSI